MAARHNEQSSLLPRDATTATTPAADTDREQGPDDASSQRREVSQGTAFFAGMALPLYLFFTFLVILPTYGIVAVVLQHGVWKGPGREFGLEPRLYLIFIAILTFIARRLWVTVSQIFPDSGWKARLAFVVIYWFAGVGALIRLGCDGSLYSRNCGFGRQRDHE
ncbi:hypothetical protein LTR86_010047 [Recurvomyces mirabilis]|nr:hypothetical protein LTR86_010047 [Recurvomyces mirabilis]